MLPDSWYRGVCRVATALYYRRVRLVGRGVDRDAGRDTAVLYVGLHRNGAVDGMVYKTLFPRATFLVAARLLRSAFSRLFFTGIPVARAKDGGDRAGADASLAACVAHLRAGGELFVFPEGTSDLGPRHLPFKRGAARVWAELLASGRAPTVVPVAIFYRAPERFRSDVAVVVGEPLAEPLAESLDAPPVGDESRDALADACHRRIAAALESLGVNVASAEELARVERLAAVAADGDLDRYYHALKRLERGAPLGVLDAPAVDDWRRVESAIADGSVATEYGAPVYSRRALWWSLLWLALQAPVVGAAALANALPLAAASLAGRRLADARNTIALWRILVGLPAFVAWTLGVAIACLVAGRPWWLVAYVALTAAGLALYHELVARWARVRNALCAPSLGAPLLAVRRRLDELLARDAATTGAPLAGLAGDGGAP
jgi:1-acyl-sn-glycerol-3-phosphate acyltransferase